MRMTAWRSDAQNALEVGEPVVAAKAGFIAEEQQHRRRSSPCVMMKKYTP
jgi:hypothetical protein